MRWDTVPLRKLITPCSKRNRPDLPLLSVVRDKGVIMRKLDKSDNHNIIPEDLSNYKVVTQGQFVINKMKAWQGSCGVSRFNGIVSPAYFVFDLDIENSRFFNYSIRSRAFIDEFNRISSGIRVDQWDLSMDKLKYIRFPLPPRGEQDQIVRYLDWKVTLINKLIDAKRRQIALLQEQKQVEISESVVTDSMTIKLKRAVRKLDRPYSVTDEVLICSNNGTVFYRGNRKLGVLSDKEDIFQGVSVGDLLIHGMDTWHGAIAISGYDGKCTTVVHVCDSEHDKRFIAYYLRMLAFRQLYKAISNGVRQNTSDFRSWQKAGDIDIQLPHKSKQKEIADYLDCQCERIDKAIERLTDEITPLSEYRTRLISDVVTGKLDVRGVVVPEYEAVEDNCFNDDKYESRQAESED